MNLFTYLGLKLEKQNNRIQPNNMKSKIERVRGMENERRKWNKNEIYFMYLAVIIIIVTIWRIFQAKAPDFLFLVVSGIAVISIFICMYYLLKKQKMYK